MYPKEKQASSDSPSPATRGRVRGGGRSAIAILRIAAALFIVLVSTIVHAPIVLIGGLVKAAIPIGVVRRACDRVLIGTTESWNDLNTHLIRWFTHTRLRVDIEAELRRDGHYLVLANHQSWVDIPVLEAVLNRRVPMLRFFLKSQAFVLDAMGDAMHAILDVTIVYPHGIPTIADLFADRIPEIRIHVRERPIPYGLVRGDYQNDAPFRELFQSWMNGLWAEKDARVEALLRSESTEDELRVEN